MTDSSLSRGDRPSAPGVADHVRGIFNLTGERWTAPVLFALSHGYLRFSQLLRKLPGLSQKQLTHTVRALERDGYVTRTAYATIPPRVEYELTELGSDLVNRLSVIGRFAAERQSEIEAARQRFDAPAGQDRSTLRG